MHVPADGKWYKVGYHESPDENGKIVKSVIWHAKHPSTGEVEKRRVQGLPGGKKFPRNPPSTRAFRGVSGGKGYTKDPRKVVSVAQIDSDMKTVNKSRAVTKEPTYSDDAETKTRWVYQGLKLVRIVKGDDWKKVFERLCKKHSTASLDECIRRAGVESVIQEIAWAEPKKRGAMVYVPHRAFYDWRDGKGDKDPADMKATREYLQTMAGDHARIHGATFRHPKTGEPHHGVEFQDSDKAAEFIDTLKRAGVKGDIPWHHTGD